MPELINNQVIARFEQGDAAQTSHARGQVLEDLLIYIFQHFEGVRFLEKDVRVANGSEEIDLVFWNDRVPGSLHFLPHLLLFECKNWSSPVDSASVSYFINKVRTRHLDYGFLIASNGVTGNEQDLNASHQHLHNAVLLDNVRIVLIDREELCAIGSTEELKHMIQHKIARAILRGA